MDEGKKDKMYLDERGVPTIGIGHNLRDDPISNAAISQIFQDDVNAVIAELDAQIPWYRELSDTRQRVLANMAYNLGIHGLLEFHHMLTAVKASDWKAAGTYMLASNWAKQVPVRANRLARMMLAG